MSILDVIDSHALLKPETTAYCNHTHKDACSLTYARLVDMADKLAFYIQETLKDNKSPLVVYGHKSPYMLVCFLACVKSGRAYCPVDISVPLDRVNNIINEAKPPLILCTEPLDLDVDNIVDLSAIRNIIQNCQQKIDKCYYVSGEDVFYIIFTSGSTGTPKGVQITTSCLDNFVKWAVTLGNPDIYNKHLTFINQAPFSFDLSVMDVYMCLYSGGTLWALEKSVQTDIKALFESLKNSKANVWVSTPSFADMCLSDRKFSSELMPSLDLFLFCGETLTNSTASKLHNNFPNAKVVNTYGPTESTVAVTQVEITPELNAATSPLPVGKPKDGTHIFILDKSGNVLPDEEKGEIVIVGNTVSIGYFNRDDITKKSFSSMQIDGHIYRLYHTGDKGYIKDSQLYYCGRIDLQIKLHGYRIEIEDIENNIVKLDDIKNAIVVPVYKEGSIKSLTAFAIPTVPVDEKNKFKASQTIRSKLAKFVPNYMIPKKIIFLDSIPMTGNGKADRKYLGGLLK